MVSAQGLGMADTLVEGIGIAGTPNGGVLTVQGVVGGIAQPVSGSVSITGTVDVSDRAARLVGIVDTELPAAAALSDAFANPTAPAVGAMGMIWEAVSGTWQRFLSGVGPSQTAAKVVHAGTNTYKSNLPAANVAATVTFPGSVGKRWQLHFLEASVRQGVALAAATTLRIWDGATGTTLLFSIVLSSPAQANGVDRFVSTDLNLLGTAGLAMTIDFTGGAGATNFEEINASAYLSN